MTYQEKVEFALFQIRYMATQAESNGVYLELHQDPEHQEFVATEMAIHYGQFVSDSEEGRKLCRRYAELQRSLSVKAHNILVMRGFEV